MGPKGGNAVSASHLLAISGTHDPEAQAARTPALIFHQRTVYTSLNCAVYLGFVRP